MAALQRVATGGRILLLVDGLWRGTTALALVFVTACGGGAGEQASTTPSAASPTVRALGVTSPMAEGSPKLPNIAVVGLTKVSETRIGRTEFEYVYKVTVSNTGAPAADVTATLAQVPPGTRIVDGRVVFGSVPNTQTSSDTITIRQDRTIAFTPTALSWAITLAPTAAPVSSDANHNNIRDDIDLAIKTIVQAQPTLTPAVEQVARRLQAFVDAPSDLPLDSIRAMLLNEMDAGICLRRLMLDGQATLVVQELVARTYDTSERRSKRQRLLSRLGAIELPTGGESC